MSSLHDAATRADSSSHRARAGSREVPLTASQKTTALAAPTALLVQTGPVAAQVVGGLVVDSRGCPVRGAIFEVQPQVPGRCGDPVYGPRHSVETDPGGRYSVPLWKPSHPDRRDQIVYRVEVDAPGYVVAEAEIRVALRAALARASRARAVLEPSRVMVEEADVTLDLTVRLD